jgi:hypothetical protein
VVALAAGTAGRRASAYTLPDTPNPKDYQPAPPGAGLYLGRILFSPWLTLNAGYDDNIFSVTQGVCGQRLRRDTNGDGLYDSLTCVKTLSPEGTSLGSARAQLGFRLPYSHSFLSLVWNGQYRDYGQIEAPEKTSQYAQLENRLNFSNGSMLSVKGEAVWGYQEVQHVNSEGFVDNRLLEEPGSLAFSSSRFRRNHPELQYDFYLVGSWGLSSHIERNSVTFDAISQASGASGSVGGPRISAAASSTTTTTRTIRWI